MRGVIVAALAAALIGAGAAGASVQRGKQLRHVTLIGDSVADAIAVNPPALDILTAGINLDAEVAPCRRVDGEGCPFQGVRPPSVVDVAKTLGSKIGPNVVVAVGYNDFEDQYAANIDAALAAFKADGVQKVFWLTLRAARHPYLSMNDDIAAAAAQHPELTVVDWNVYSRSHPDWFQTDGIHLAALGANGMATLIHKALVTAGIAIPPLRVLTNALPIGQRGRTYATRLHAAAGLPPYRWSLLERAPSGIHLEPNGVVEGAPHVRPGRYTFNVRVNDASGYTATRRLTLRVAA
jgi:Putative Ig domain